ncbi:MAG TPA: GNAT family N-acetyltransferase, partial [Pyrinomonadaceae bacterium]|nr:GNAT family N-acetyltransferase [Pyrinomonadaceae bacterium]
MEARRSEFSIEPLTEAHWEQVRAVYLEGIATGQATFETQAPAWERWDASHLPHSRLVALAGRTVKGWAALSRVSDRCVYGGVAEVSVYVGASYRGQGVGRALLGALVESSELNGVWTLQAGVFPENEASV